MATSIRRITTIVIKTFHMNLSMKSNMCIVCMKVNTCMYELCKKFAEIINVMISRMIASYMTYLKFYVND